MAKTLYLEGASGIAGNMLVGALLDLGGREEHLRAALASLPFDGYELHIAHNAKWGLSGTSFDVHLTAHEHPAHHHEHPEHPHHHTHRNLADVTQIIDAGNLTARARTLAHKAFQIVAEAEAQAHGTTVAAVHFHEVGAIDSICDIVGAAVLIDDLGITDVIVTGLAEGAGLIDCAHGALPIPVPAVTNIAQRYAIPLRLGMANTELVTPTGIALAAALCTTSALPPSCTFARVGIGFGTREIGRANCLRAFLLADEAPSTGDRVWVLEANVDDATGEELGIAMKAFLAAGARDCTFAPCFMKKNRPGWLIHVLADERQIPALEHVFFRETTTIGVRRYPVQRTLMAREQVSVALPEGDVSVKRCTYGDIVRVMPEAESVRAYAERTGDSFQRVYTATLAQMGQH